MADSKLFAKELCNYCKKKTTKKVVNCPKCEKIYHNSCATRVTCCEVKLSEQNKTELDNAKPSDNEEDMDILSLTISNEELLIENQELKQLNRELKEQITQLKQTIKNLQSDKEFNNSEHHKKREEVIKLDIKSLIHNEIDEKMSHYLEDLNNLKHKVSKLESSREKDMSTVQKKPGEQKTLVNKDAKEVKKPQQNVTKNEFEKADTSNQTNLQVIKNKQIQIMNEVINLESTAATDIQLNLNNVTQNKKSDVETLGINKGRNGSTNNEDNLGFIYPKNRRRFNQNKTIIGENEDSTKLKAVSPLSWIFISRLEPDTSVENVEAYLKDHDIITTQCVKLNTFSNEIAAFKIAVNKQDEEKIYCGQTWPKKTIIRPYEPARAKNFRKTPPTSLIK